MLASAISAARPRVIAALAGHCRDLTLAEDGFADAVEALLRLPDDQRPANVGGWLYVTARRRILDALRKVQRGEAAAAALAVLQEEPPMAADLLAFPEAIPDDRLRLVFAACHPAIAPDIRAALSLKLLFGVDMARLAAAFLTSAATLYQRIGRATAKIRDAGIGFEVPERRFWPERLEAVLATLELAYAVAYQDAACAADADLAPEVQRLSGLLVDLLPDEPEVLALAAMIAFGEARRPARVDADGAMVPLSEQDVNRWDRAAISRGTALMDRAAALTRPGPRQLLAAIHLTHARRLYGAAPDWAAILLLYDELARHRPTPAVAIARALAIGQVDGAVAGLAALAELDSNRLITYRPYACAYAQLLAAAGETAEAARWWRVALALGPPPAEACWIERQSGAGRLNAGPAAAIS